MTTNTTLELSLAGASGVWLVRCRSSTLYVVDADRRAVLRRAGPGGENGAEDSQWQPLERLRSLSEDGQGIIRLGEREEYVFERAARRSYGRWIQRAVTSIERATPHELASLPVRLVRRAARCSEHVPNDCSPEVARLSRSEPSHPNPAGPVADASASTLHGDPRSDDRNEPRPHGVLG